DIVDLFVPRFYFGVEADDPKTAWAFNTKTNPFGQKLRVVLGSDIGHWDVPDMLEVVPDVYAQVEAGLLTPEDLRDLCLANAVQLHAGMNPDFFKGTRVQDAAEGELRKIRVE